MRAGETFAGVEVIGVPAINTRFGKVRLKMYHS